MPSVPQSNVDEDVATYVRQQEVVADLGVKALERNDLDRLMADATVAVIDTLDADYAKVLELLPQSESLLLRHGVGWDDGIVGAATVPTDQDSQAGYTLLSEQPVVVDDMQAEARFYGPDLLIDHDVVSGISVIIGSVDEPWGVLGVHTTDQREFTENDANFVQSVANVLATAIENAQTERRFEAIFEDPNILVGLLEPDGTVMDINQTAMEYIDPELDDVIGEPFWETPWWGSGDDVRGDVREWTTRAASGEYVEFEADLTRPNREQYTLNGVFRPVTNGDDEVVSIIVSDRDITERKRRERQLKKSEQRHRTLAENFPNGIVTMFDDELRYTLAAGRGFDDLPLSASNVEGKHVRDVWPGDIGRNLESAFRDALEGETSAVEGEYARREWIIRVVPLTDDDGEVFAGMTIAQDITEQAERQRKLEESNRRLEQFAYAASHDLQEPLRMVSSYLQLLEHRYANELDDDAEEFLGFAVDGADRMRDMINGLLEYSRVDTQGDPLEPVELESVVDDVLEDLHIQLEESNADVTVESLPRVRGDSGQLRQVFQNLFSNAITYSGNEPPRIHVTADRRERTWQISMRDDGIGIAPEDQATVFEVFQRLHTREEHAGTGIGLALCERIVERHGGRIWVESEPGEGATFSFTLPALE
ncbi:ATP-binding protein [Natrialbaceae archaeon A-CW1-1]